MKLSTAPRNRKSAKKLYLREKSLRSKNPSLVSVGAIISDQSHNIKEYARQLREKQKVRRMYGVSEAQFKKYYRLATSAHQNAAERLLQILELRLDNIVYRAGLGLSRAAARQLVSHGWIKVNGKKVNIPSYLVSTDDIIAPTKRLDFFSDRTFDMVPEWLTLDKKKLEVKVMRLPNREDSDPDINEQSIVEFYSR